MQTISSSKSLIYFDQNRNGSNIINNGSEDIRLLLKPHYYNVFNNIAVALGGGVEYFSKFIPVWQNVIRQEVELAKNTIRKYIGDTARYESDDINKVIHKFRGNLGEILAEYLFSNGEISYCQFGTYEPADPNNEEFVDATAVSKVTELLMGIQIKNYKEDLVSRETFVKACCMSDLYARESIEDEAAKLEYLSTPHQIIFSFTDARDNLKERYVKSVIFFGPKDIEKLKLQGDIKHNIKPKSLYFKKIAEEINKVD